MSTFDSGPGRPRPDINVWRDLSGLPPVDEHGYAMTSPVIGVGLNVEHLNKTSTYDTDSDQVRLDVPDKTWTPVDPLRTLAFVLPIDDLAAAWVGDGRRMLSVEEIDEMFHSSQMRSLLRRNQPGRWWPIALLVGLVLGAIYFIGATGGI